MQLKHNIVVVGSVYSRSGYGAHSRDIVSALWKSRKFNISVLPTRWGSTSTTMNLSSEMIDLLNATISNKIPQNIPFTFVHIGIPPEFKKVSAVNIGITAGLETTFIPKSWVDGCNQMDGIIVPSLFEKDLFQKSGVTVPVYTVGEGVDTNIFFPTNDSRSPLKFESFFNFLTGGQWIMNGDRKGIGKLITLFCDMFQNDPNVGLVVKTFLNNLSTVDYEFTKKTINDIKGDRKYPYIYLIHGDMTDFELSQLYNHPSIKAFISVTSGEGWGRLLCEAASCDLPVMTTGWSGLTDFLDPNYSTLFKYTLQDIPSSLWGDPNNGIFEKGMQWAIPDLEDVKTNIKDIIRNYDFYKGRAIEQGKVIREKWNRLATNKQLVTAIEDIIKKVNPNL